MDDINIPFDCIEECRRRLANIKIYIGQLQHIVK